VIVISPELNTEISPLVYGGTGTDSLLDIQPYVLPEYLESGTLNTVGIAGLAEGIRFCMNEKNAISSKISSLFSYAYSELEKIPHIRLFSPKTDNVGIISFSVDGIDSEQITRFLDSEGICVRGGFHCSALFHKKALSDRFGLVRVSPGVFNTKKYIFTFIISIKRLKK
ncbi:MAG: aminotransferase class V-fold PLP-dependent enzyme, partial [Clostridia bacterium]|nr:aminotransferase class V-fold PLP-dependent enzyme [Clostridia bacterium]